MKRFLILLPVLFGLSSTANAKLRPVDETAYQALLKQSGAKVVLVDFWASWCEPCREEMPALVKLARRYAPQGLKFITVSIDGPAELHYAEKFLRAQGVPLPAYYKAARKDDAFINSVDPNWSGALPALFFYTRDGKLVKSYVGETEAETVEGAVRELLARTPP